MKSNKKSVNLSKSLQAPSGVAPGLAGGPIATKKPAAVAGVPASEQRNRSGGGLAGKAGGSGAALAPAKPIAAKEIPVGKTPVKAVAAASAPARVAEAVMAKSGTKSGDAKVAAAPPVVAANSVVGTAKEAVKPAPAKMGGASARKAPAVLTTIEVRYDVGLGNQLYIRGEGAGLTWAAGMPMECRGGDLWVWTTDKPVENIVFKVLVNDAGWSAGENFAMRPGGQSVFYPSF